MCVITPIRRNYGFENKVLTRPRASPARRRTRPRSNPAGRLTRPRNIPLAMTMKNVGHSAMSMKLRGRAFGPRKLRHKAMHIFVTIHQKMKLPERSGCGRTENENNRIFKSVV